MTEWVAFAIFVFFSLLGLAFSFFTIGGTFFVVVGAALYNMITWSWTISMEILVGLLVIAVFGEILEWLIVGSTLKKHRLSGLGWLGLIVGGLLGSGLFSFLPIIGPLLGIFLGAALGTYVGELLHTSEHRQAFKAVRKFFISRGIVAVAKVCLVIVQIVLVLWAI